MTATKQAQVSGVHDFDFLIGHWTVQHRRLQRRLVGDTNWQEFAGTLTCWKILEGVGNIEEVSMPAIGQSGATLRLFDPVHQRWSLYWASSKTGRLCPPVVGRFHDGTGEFYGDDTEGENAVRVRYIWSRITPNSARWEQAFSVDDAATWETNWFMDFARQLPDPGSISPGA